MRTTLEIDDTVLAAARSLAASEKLSLGAAVSKLALRGLERDHRVDVVYSPFSVLHSPDGHVITPEMIAEHRDD